ncbi:ORF2 transposase [Neochlamydia sp. TUME1]|nr:ORF2 transposase [Neochlamydia sp. TUME1]
MLDAFKIILQIFPIKRKVWLIIDRTNWQVGSKNINILTLAMAYEGTAIPLAWFVMNKAGNSSTDERIELLEKVIRQLGPSKIAGLIGDREFIGSQWFDYLIKSEIPFYMRIREDTLVEGARNGYAVSLRDVFRHLKEGKKKVLVQPLQMLGHSFYVAASRLKDELLLVVTNKNPKKAISIYKTRWEIETLFACLKTRGFCLEDTHLTYTDRIEKLIFALSIAFCWAYKLGNIAANVVPISIKKHGRKAKSLFRYGLDKIRKILLGTPRCFNLFLWLLKLFDPLLSSSIPKRVFL